MAMMAVMKVGGFGGGQAGGGGTGFLGAGVYWHGGTGLFAPTAANFAVTTKQTDGIAGDQTTGDTAAGTPYIKVLHVGSISVLNSWPQTIGYDGTGASAFEAWDGGSWTVLADTNVTGWPTNGAYASQSRTATFAAEAIPNVGGLYYILATFASGENGPQSTDSRPSA